MGLKNQLWFRHHHHWVEIWEVVPQGQYTEAVVQRRPQLDLKLAAEHRNVYWFWRLEGVVENNLVPMGQSQLQERLQNWRSYREKVRPGTVRGQVSLLVKLQPQLQCRPQNIGAGLNLQDMLCVTKGRAGNIDVPKPFGAQKIVVHPRCQSGIELQDLELLCWALVLIKYGCSYALVLLF